MTQPFCDGYGNALTTQSDAACEAYRRGTHLYLGGHFAAIEEFETATRADQQFALGHVALARALTMSGRMADAKSSIARAVALADTVDDREASHIAAHALMLAGNAAGCRKAVLAHVRDYPRDAMVAQLCTSVFGLIGFSGEVGREAALLAYTETLAPHYEGDWWMMSMHAVALCETGQVNRSLNLMEKALALNPRNANAAHFKAHAQYENGEALAGREFLTGWMTDYDPKSVLHGHLSWHQALWAMQDGDTDDMWQAIDNRIGPDGAQGLPINVLTDTVALLFRAEIAGHAVGSERWRQISDYAAQYFPNTGQCFADLHAALGHAMAGDGDRLAHIIDTAKGYAGDLVAPVAKAWKNVAHQNWAAALDELSTVMATTERFGGSRAQRDLIELAYVHILLKLGQTDEAQRALLTRRPVLAKSPPVAGFE